MITVLRRLALAIPLCVTAWIGQGCEGPAAVMDAFQNGEPVAALYILPDVRTVVVVDDPKNFMGNPGLVRQIGTTAVHFLRHEQALETAEFVEPRDIALLEARLDEKWTSMPIAEIGRRLGAEQVIYARIKQVTMHVAGNVYRPEAVLDVKVLQSADGKRLWPNATALPDPEKAAPSHTLTIQMKYETRDSRYFGDATPDDLARKLAERIGQELAQLFYDWRRPPAGQTL